nr:sigma-54 factor interaction domain-containing protein [Thermoanaerobaculia bacterium]
MSARPSTQAVEAPTRTESGSWAETTDLRVPGLTIAWHPDPARIGDRVALTELAAGREASLSRLSPAFFPAGGGEPRPLEDTFLSRSPMLLSLQEGGAGGMTLSPGQARTRLIADGEPVEGRRSFSRAELERGVALLLADRVLLLLHLQLPFSLERPPSYGLVGESASLGRVRTAIARVADLEVPVLLSGETGTGKELVAQALHVAGPRRKGPFLTINLGAVPTSLAASELFGAASGAFTGAQRRRAGYFEQAHGGTLFLDEIGEAPSEVQVLLLRALETGEIQPVGAES